MSSDRFNRGVLRALALALLLTLAGCQTTTTTTPTPTTSEAPTTTVATSQEPITSNATTTAPSLNATVRFESCTRVTVSAESYYWVGVIAAESTQEHDGDYSGTTTYRMDSAIQEVIVAGEHGERSVVNPAYEACTTPETTTTTMTTVVTTTTTPEPTTVTTTTQKPTTTFHTHTTTREPREELHKYEITTHIESKTLGENATATFIVTNYHERATVSLDYDVGWYTNLRSGGYLQESITRTHLVLAPGESATVRVAFGENASIDKIDYAVSNLDHAEDNE